MANFKRLNSMIKGKIQQNDKITEPSVENAERSCTLRDMHHTLLKAEREKKKVAINNIYFNSSSETSSGQQYSHTNIHLGLQYPKSQYIRKRAYCFKNANSSSGDIMWELKIEIKNLESKVCDLKKKIKEQEEENKYLRKQLSNQANELKILKNEKCNIPSLMKSHNDEMKAMQAELSKTRGELNACKKQLKSKLSPTLFPKNKDRMLQMDEDDEENKKNLIEFEVQKNQLMELNKLLSMNLALLQRNEECLKSIYQYSGHLFPQSSSSGVEEKEDYSQFEQRKVESENLSQATDSNSSQGIFVLSSYTHLTNSNLENYFATDRSAKNKQNPYNIGHEQDNINLEISGSSESENSNTSLKNLTSSASDENNQETLSTASKDFASALSPTSENFKSDNSNHQYTELSNDVEDLRSQSDSFNSETLDCDAKSDVTSISLSKCELINRNQEMNKLKQHLKDSIFCFSPSNS